MHVMYVLHPHIPHFLKDNITEGKGTDVLKQIINSRALTHFAFQFSHRDGSEQNTFKGRLSHLDPIVSYPVSIYFIRKQKLLDLILTPVRKEGSSRQFDPSTSVTVKACGWRDKGKYSLRQRRE